MAKFKNKYRIESNRLKNWDYSSKGKYFITLVTQHRVCYLGYVENKKMILSDFGRIVETEWYKSFEIRQELFLDSFIIMPNHIHAIVEIRRDLSVEAYGRLLSVESNGRSTQPINGRSTQPILNDFYRLPKSISSFLAGFKSAVNSKIDDYIDENQLNLPKFNRQNHFFQANYYDHIIRNEYSLKRIRQYIINNPKNWREGK